MACQKGYHDVVQSLLGAGADVNIPTSTVSDVIHSELCTECYDHNLNKPWVHHYVL